MQARIEKRMGRPSLLVLTKGSYDKRAVVEIELTSEQATKIEVNMAPIGEVT